MSWSDDSIDKQKNHTKSNFNIDSFLNAEPIPFHNNKWPQKHIMNQRMYDNRN